jgi:manganese/zinc/iron transport system substrate-binding protein
MKSRILLAALGFAFALTLLTGCHGDGNNSDKFAKRVLSVKSTHSGARPIKVVVTTGMVADLVRNVGGSLVQVDQLMGADVDPHLYKATSTDVDKLNKADVVFYSGLHLEGKMAETLERLGRKRNAFAVAEYLDPSKVLTDEHKHPDPHVWFDVELWSEVAQVIGDALAMYDPANAETYKKQTTSYRAELAKVHAEAKTVIAAITPKEKRVLITSHDAFRYFGRAYDIEVKGIQGISTDAEASVRDINNLVDFIVARKVNAVFVETSVNQRNMKSLQEGCKARGHDVALGGELFSDAMGKDGTPEGTYIGMIRHNVETIAKALR